MKKYALILLLAYTYTWPALAEYNGEKWSNLLNYNWRMGAGCPEYVEQVAIEFMDTYAPVNHIYNGYVPDDYPSALNRDGISMIYCSDQEPAVTAEVPEPDIARRESELVAGKAVWWYNTSQNRIFECDIWLRNSTLNELTVHRYVGHELMHCYGLQHDPDPLALMYFAPTATAPHVYDKGELARLYEYCEVLTDAAGNLFVPRAWFVEWLQQQPELVQQTYAAYLLTPASLIMLNGTNYPGDAKRIRPTTCN